LIQRQKTQSNKQQPASLEQLKQPMKNSSLKGLLAAALLLVSSNVFAQSTPVTATTSANAEIIQLITVAQVEGRQLEFSRVASGVAKTIATDGSVSFGGAQGINSGDESSAAFVITKATEIPVLLTVSGLGNLVDPAGETTTEGSENGLPLNVLSASYTIDAVVDLALEGQGVEIPVSGLTAELQINDDAAVDALNDVETMYVRIGGTVTPTAGQAPGSYTKQITLSAVYN
jgi:hypothetical protein